MAILVLIFVIRDPGPFRIPWEAGAEEGAEKLFSQKNFKDRKKYI